MYLEALKNIFAKLQAVMEDVWIERQSCRNLILDSGLMTEAKLEEALKIAKTDPAIREEMQKQFAEAWRKLDEAEKQAACELHLLEPPPTDKPS
jgi:hypothetical protein